MHAVNPVEAAIGPTIRPQELAGQVNEMQTRIGGCVSLDHPVGVTGKRPELLACEGGGDADVSAFTSIVG